MIRVHHDTVLRLFLSQLYDEDAPGSLVEIGLVIGQYLLGLNPTDAAAPPEASSGFGNLMRLDKSNTCATSSFASDLEVSVREV